ncbi:putative HEAT repeat protein [Toxoplasma gondii ARI]|uniref:Putative HEAT repeat protein n=1 Tax=Toxoplasma gondii ARI TaxID=1074872 RepID=A0A139XQC5_TOXGO|nr:putative HEAT repeat protein [Toxoplasma gondii ARI]
MFSLSRDSASAALSAGSQAGHPGELLSPQILRALGDKSQEKRKAAAHEVEALVRRLVHRRAEAAARLQSRVEAPSQSVSSPPRARTETGASGREEAARARGLRDRARLCETQQSEEAPVAAQIEAEDAKLLHIVAVLDKEFLLQGLPNHRKGGLVALASVAIALEAQVSHFLPFLLPPLLRAFSDPESRVRYYACEASQLRTVEGRTREARTEKEKEEEKGEGEVEKKKQNEQDEQKEQEEQKEETQKNRGTLEGEMTKKRGRSSTCEQETRGRRRRGTARTRKP